MKQIKLTQNKITFVDDDDFEFLNQYKWCAVQIHGIWYASRGKIDKRTKKGIKGKLRIFFMHRIIMNITDKNIFIDHKDGNGLNNQKFNLRTCTNAENLRNRKANGISKYLGVSRSIQIHKYNHKQYIYWNAIINANGKRKYLNRFPYTKEGEISAAKAYNEAAKKHHGEFARLNIF